MNIVIDGLNIEYTEVGNGIAAGVTPVERR